MRRYLFVLVAAVSLSCAKNTIDYNEVISEMHSCNDTAQWTAPDFFNALSGTYDWQYVQSWGWGGAYQSESDFTGWTLILNADSTYSVNGADTVWYGAAEVDSLAGYWDGSNEFVDSMNSLIALNREHRINIEAPLLTMSKEAIVEEGVRLGVDFSNTWTCYSNRKDGLADATTPSSSMRVKGFVDAGYQDPIQYVQQSKLNELYLSKGCKKL